MDIMEYSTLAAWRAAKARALRAWRAAVRAIPPQLVTPFEAWRDAVDAAERAEWELLAVVAARPAPASRPPRRARALLSNT